jgi:hypothetical protein
VSRQFPNIFPRSSTFLLVRMTSQTVNPDACVIFKSAVGYPPKEIAFVVWKEHFSFTLYVLEGKVLGHNCHRGPRGSSSAAFRLQSKEVIFTCCSIIKCVAQQRKKFYGQVRNFKFTALICLKTNLPKAKNKFAPYFAETFIQYFKMKFYNKNSLK